MQPGQFQCGVFAHAGNCQGQYPSVQRSGLGPLQGSENLGGVLFAKSAWFGIRAQI